MNGFFDIILFCLENPSKKKSFWYGKNISENITWSYFNKKIVRLILNRITFVILDINNKIIKIIVSVSFEKMIFYFILIRQIYPFSNP